MIDDTLPAETPMPPEFAALLAGLEPPRINWKRAWITAGAIAFLGWALGYTMGRIDGKMARR